MLQYDVYEGDRVVGSTTLELEGLYYRVYSFCENVTKEFPRLYAVLGERRIKIGVFKTQDTGFVLDKRIPAKSLDLSSVTFSLDITDSHRQGGFIPVSSQNAIPDISVIMNARFYIQDGKKGILV